eukprot:scaffold38195_cov64-Phaeocystis_antarctica.AAC.11
MLVTEAVGSPTAATGLRIAQGADSRGAACWRRVAPARLPRRSGGARQPMTTLECWRIALLAASRVLVQQHSQFSLRTSCGRRPAPGRAIVERSLGRLPLWATSHACVCCTNWAATRRPAWR